MLKYRINSKNVVNDNNIINVIENSIGDYDLEQYNQYNQYICTCKCNDIKNIENNRKILVKNNIVVENDNDRPNSIYSLYKEYTVTDVNKNDRTFSFLFDKYYNLPLVTVSYVKLYDSYHNDYKKYLYLYFVNSHFYSISNKTFEVKDNKIIVDDNVYNVFNGKVLINKNEYDVVDGKVTVDGIDYEVVDNKVIIPIIYNVVDGKVTVDGIDYEVIDDTITMPITTFNLWFNYIDNNGNIRFDKKRGFEYVNASSLRMDWDNIKDDDLIRVIFDNIIDDNSDNISGNINLINLFRINPEFTEDSIFDVYINTSNCSIPVAISNNFQTNIYKEQTLHEYIEDAKKRSINRINDNEKDVYYPVINKGGQKNETVYKIKFNLHFREHRGEDWVANSESYWNGVAKDENDNNKLKLNEDFFSYKNKESEQSDLLSYLGFTNNDIRFQKNKLKKSFLRLLFYDSTNPSNQNLIAYSTIFMDSGEYFTKFVRYIEESPYRQFNENGEVERDDDNNITEYKGIKVNREPDGTLLTEKDIEEYRLSSQLVVYDKYNSSASSEGFYLYLWRDLLKEVEDKYNGLELYMKVEFNHAGYGRVIPFMMPFWDKKKWETEGRFKEGIKSFDEILADWNNETDTDGEYGVRQYMKFSYIHLRIGYDKKEKKYIYYLDDNFYDKNCQGEESNTITINLYEAKMV